MILKSNAQYPFPASSFFNIPGDYLTVQKIYLLLIRFASYTEFEPVSKEQLYFHI